MKIFPEYKLLYLRAVALWAVLLGLIPLSILHTGFWNVFVFLTWVLGLGGIAVIIAAVAIVLKSENESEASNDADKERESMVALAKALVTPMYKKHGIDRINSEKEQKFLDRTCLWGTTLYLIFTGHITLAMLWLVRVGSSHYVHMAYDHLDDAIIEEI
jgi:hypothetical protein